MNCLPPQTQSDLEIQRTYLFRLYHPPLPPPSLISHPPRRVQSSPYTSLPLHPLPSHLLSFPQKPIQQPTPSGLSHTPPAVLLVVNGLVLLCVWGGVCERVRWGVFVSGLGEMGEWMGWWGGEEGW